MNNLTSPFINEQGVVGVSTPTVLATGKNASYTSSSSVSSLRFSNPAAYTITLKKYDASQNTLLEVYEYQLSAGDTLIDTNTYQLAYNDRLEVQSSVAGTNYFVMGVK